MPVSWPKTMAADALKRGPHIQPKTLSLTKDGDNPSRVTMQVMLAIVNGRWLTHHGEKIECR